jgi:hypothetical protein
VTADDPEKAGNGKASSVNDWNATTVTVVVVEIAS